MNILKTVGFTESPWIRSRRVVCENNNGYERHKSGAIKITIDLRSYR
jgi:hypothetical protein